MRSKLIPTSSIIRFTVEEVHVWSIWLTVLPQAGSLLGLV
jgi:hypothetical protein